MDKFEEVLTEKKSEGILITGIIGSGKSFLIRNQIIDIMRKYSDKPIVQNIDNWFIYASDGTCFNQDLIARSDYEETLLWIH